MAPGKQRIDERQSGDEGLDRSRHGGGRDFDEQRDVERQGEQGRDVERQGEQGRDVERQGKQGRESGTQTDRGIERSEDVGQTGERK
jgi:hypothetical protein